MTAMRRMAATLSCAIANSFFPVQAAIMDGSLLPFIGLVDLVSISNSKRKGVWVCCWMEVLELLVLCRSRRE